MTNKSFFVLEDNSFQRKVITTVLKTVSPEKVIEFSNGKEAYDFLKKTRKNFDVFILDLNVPELDGLKFLEEAAKIVPIKNIIIISAMDDDILKSVKEYANFKSGLYIEIYKKPIIPETFLELIRRVFAEKGYEYKTGIKNKLTSREFNYEEIMKGIVEREFFPFYQPQIDIMNNKVVGLEALARWEHKYFGLIPPYKFIPVIEESDNEIKQAFTFLLLDKVADDILKIKGKGYEYIKCSLNVFLSILELENFCDMFINIVKKYGIEKNIIVEVTESGISESKATLNYSLSRLRIKGIDISLDDFGTGYASLLQLASFPFSEIKIDRSFVRELGENNKNMKIVKMANLLANELGLKIIAEGAEKESDIQKLKEIGVPIVQGYYFSRPLDFEGIVSFISSF